jgi:hypothetical protein
MDFRRRRSTRRVGLGAVVVAVALLANGNGEALATNYKRHLHRCHVVIDRRRNSGSGRLHLVS